MYEYLHFVCVCMHIYTARLICTNLCACVIICVLSNFYADILI